MKGIFRTCFSWLFVSRKIYENIEWSNIKRRRNIWHKKTQENIENHEKTNENRRAKTETDRKSRRTQKNVEQNNLKNVEWEAVRYNASTKQSFPFSGLLVSHKFRAHFAALHFLNITPFLTIQKPIEISTSWESFSTIVYSLKTTHHQLSNEYKIIENDSLEV